MQVTVKGMHLDVGDALRSHVEENLTHAAQKYFSNPIDATVIFTKEKNHRFKANISIRVSKGAVLEAQFEADDPYPAFDEAARRVAKRLGKYKDKLRDHHRDEDTVDLHLAAYTTFESNENEAEGGTEPAVIAELEMPVQTLAVADAVMHLELRELPALLFKNPAHGGYNLVYRRKDGNIGWVDPEGIATAKEKIKAKK